MAGFPTYKNVSAPDLSNLIKLQSQGTSNAFNSLANIGNTIQSIQQKNRDTDARNLLAQATLANLNDDPNTLNNIFNQTVSNKNIPLTDVNAVGNLIKENKDTQQSITDQQLLTDLASKTPLEIANSGNNLFNNRTSPLPEPVINSVINARKDITADKNLIQGAKLLANSKDPLNPENTATNVSQIPENLLAGFGLGKEVSDIIKKGPETSQKEQNKKYTSDQTYQTALTDVPIFDISKNNPDNKLVGPAQLDSLESYVVGSVLSPLSTTYKSKLDTINSDPTLTEEQRIQQIKKEKINYENSLGTAVAKFKKDNNIPDDVISSILSTASQYNINSNNLINTNNVKKVYGDAVGQLNQLPDTRNSLITKPENQDIYNKQQSRIEQSLFNKNALENNKITDTSTNDIANSIFKDVKTADDVGRVISLKTNRSAEDSAKQIAYNVEQSLNENPYFKSLNKKVNYSKLGAIMLQNTSPQTTIWGLVLGDGLGDVDSYLKDTDDISEAQYLASEDPNFKTQLDIQKNKVITASTETEKIRNELDVLENKLLVERENGINTTKTSEKIKNKEALYNKYVNDLDTLKSTSKDVLEGYLKTIGFKKIKDRNINNNNVNNAKQIAVPIATF